MGRVITYSNEPPEEPAIARNFAREMGKWGRSGFRRTPKVVSLERSRTCLQCEHWIDAARAGLGKCELCGCSRLMWRIATKSCPAGKWQSVNLNEK